MTDIAIRVDNPCPTCPGGWPEIMSEGNVAEG